MAEEAIKVLITGSLHPLAIQSFQANERFQVSYLPDCPREVLLKEVRHAQVLVSRSETTVDKEVLESARDLKVVARAAVGVGNIDIPLATEKGILVINTPGKNTNSAAEMTLALLLAMLRNVPQADTKVKGGGWDRHTFVGTELRDKTIGLVGLGNVGHRVAKFARGFDMKVLAYDPYIAKNMFDRHQAYRCETLEELISQVDILSVHVPLNKETTNMIAEAELSQLKPGAFVVNAARGGIIHEADLLKSLQTGHIAGAAVDTWVGEPKINLDLAKHPKVWVAPHIGASTIEAQLAIGKTIYAQVVKSVQGGVVDYPVNLPQVGVMDNPLTKPYAVLAEKLGAFACQLISFNPEKVSIQYRGDLADTNSSLIRLAFMKGYASKSVNGFVSFVNAEQHFEKLGIELCDIQDPGFDSYRSALKVNITSEGGKNLSVGGTVFDQTYPRISLIDDFYFEVDPNGEFIVVENLDLPGVIGNVGTFLGQNHINIDSFDLARSARGGRAIAMIKVDSSPDHEVVRKLSKLDHIERVHSISL